MTGRIRRGQRLGVAAASGWASLTNGGTLVEGFQGCPATDGRAAVRAELRFPSKQIPFEAACGLLIFAVRLLEFLTFRWPISKRIVIH